MPAYGRKTACKLFCKAGGQGCIAMVHAMVQYAKSMVKLDKNAVF
jgi:hypothetical protein